MNIKINIPARGVFHTSQIGGRLGSGQVVVGSGVVSDRSGAIWG